MQTLPRDECGTTLLELMVAMLLLTIALVGLAASLPFSMYGVAEGGLQSTGTALAQATIEDAERTAYASLPSLDTAGSAIAVPGFPGFTRQIVVTDYSGSPPACSGSTASPPMRCLSVIVFFTGEQGPVQTTLTTVIASP